MKAKEGKKDGKKRMFRDFFVWVVCSDFYLLVVAYVVLVWRVVKKKLVSSFLRFFCHLSEHPFLLFLESDAARVW